MTAPPTTDCLCSHKIRCSTLLNALVPHTQYLSSVPIDARFDPLQSQSRAIYPRLSREQQTEQHRTVSSHPATPIPNSFGQRQQDMASRSSSSPLLQPDTLQHHHMEPPLRSPRAGLVRAHIPPTTATPPGDAAQRLRPPPQSEDIEHPSPLEVTPQRPSVSRMARPTASKAALQQHPRDAVANRITTPEEHTSAGHLGLPPDIDNNQAQVRGPTISAIGSRTASAQRAVSRNPSVSKMATPSMSWLESGTPDHQDVDESSHESRTTAHEVYEYYQTLNPRWMHLTDNYPDIDMNQKWDQFDGDTKVGRLADLVTGFNALPATALLDATQDSEYKSCKADLERLFRDIQLHSSPPNLASVPSSIGREVPAPSKVPEPTSESFVLPSSVKAVEKRLAMSESGSTTSFQRPRTQSSRAPLPHQSSLSWGSEATPEEAPSFPSSASTKRGDAARSGPLGGSYVPTYPPDDSETENWTQSSRAPVTAPKPFQGPVREDQIPKPSRHIPADGDGYPYVFECVNAPTARKTETLLHRAPSTSSPSARRMLRTVKSVDIMNRGGQSYQYMSTRDALRNQHGNAKPEPVRNHHGEVARYYGDYMKVGDQFVPYSSAAEEA